MARQTDREAMTAQMKAHIHERFIEEIATLKAEMKNVSKAIDNLSTKLDKFISQADKKYATKEELKQVRLQAGRTENKLWDVGMKVASLAGWLFAILKITGKL